MAKPVGLGNQKEGNCYIKYLRRPCQKHVAAYDGTQQVSVLDQGCKPATRRGRSYRFLAESRGGVARSRAVVIGNIRSKAGGTISG